MSARPPAQHDRVVDLRAALGAERDEAGVREAELVAEKARYEREFEKAQGSGALADMRITAALRDQAYLAECCRRIRETREWFSGKLRTLGYDVIPSQGNYVFASPPDRDGKRVYDGLYQRKILVRHFSDPILSHGLRISIGTREDMEQTLAAIQEIG